MKVSYLKAVSFMMIPAFMACNSKTGSESGTDSTATEVSADGTATTQASYVHLNSNNKTSSAIVKDTAEGGGYVFSDTHQPIGNDLLFVDVSTGDTLYGPSGEIVNNALIQEDGVWKLDEMKIKRDGDKIKIKAGDAKLKADEDEIKVKDGDSKLKADEDESKLKTPDSKTKMEDDETKVKP